MSEIASQKLKEIGLKKTEIRIQILNYLLNQNSAISQPELEKMFKNISDRVTIYRVLSAFEENGLIHKIIDLNGTARFAICKSDNCSNHHHFDEHVHFHCKTCGNVRCLDDIQIPTFSIPNEYKVLKANINIEGICPSCNVN